MSKAKKRAEEASILAEHEYGTLGYWRAKTMREYNSRPVQYAIAILIIVAFALDLGEAQVERDRQNTQPQSAVSPTRDNDNTQP